MTLNSKICLNYMKEHFGQEVSKQQIAADAGIKEAAVMMSMRSHIKNGRATERVEENTVVDDKNKETVKKTYYYTLTEAGLAFDPEAHEEELKAKKAADQAARRAAKAAAKAAEEE